MNGSFSQGWQSNIVNMFTDTCICTHIHIWYIYMCTYISMKPYFNAKQFKIRQKSQFENEQFTKEITWSINIWKDV